MLTNLLLGQTAEDKNFIEDLFSVHLYTGNGSTQTITNGIDLAGKGGLVWVKSRSSATANYLMDTARGRYYLISNGTGQQSPQFTGSNDLVSYDANGFSIGTNYETVINSNTATYASWTFRKAPKFFDCLTFTGNGASSQSVSHSLGDTPRFIILKKTSASQNWRVFAWDGTGYKLAYLNLTNAASSASGLSSYVSSTSIDFGAISTNIEAGCNDNGASYVAYLFAHDTTADGVIQCGSFTTDGSGNATVSLGWEPQFILFKGSDIGDATSGNWWIQDNMRGYAVRSGPSNYLTANQSSAEVAANSALTYPTATGFVFNQGTSGFLSKNFIYLAIRRGPMRTPTDGTKVFTPISRTGTSAAVSVTSFGSSPDVVIIKNKANPFSLGPSFNTRLIGRSWLVSSGTAAEVSPTSSNDFLGFDVQNGYRFGTQNSQDANNSSYTYVNYGIARAPGFFDVVCYTGDGSSNRKISHNLGVAPDMIIAKRRSAANDWPVWATSIAYGSNLYLNLDLATSSGNNDVFNYDEYGTSQPPTSSNFTVGTQSRVNASGSTYVAYLFASCPGVSKVFSFTGNGSSQNIDCGFTNGARFVLIKRTDNTGNWLVADTARGIIAANDPSLALNSTAAEVTTADWLDPLSTGFTVVQESTNNANVNGATYIGLAIS